MRLWSADSDDVVAGGLGDLNGEEADGAGGASSQDFRLVGSGGRGEGPRAEIAAHEEGLPGGQGGERDGGEGLVVCRGARVWS